jgi:hypothetical protein
LGWPSCPLHHQPHPTFFQAQKKTVSPSRQRRHARLAAARLQNAEEADTTIEEIVNVEETVVNDTLEAEDKVADKATEVATSDENKMNEAEGASEVFRCYLCEFKSNWENGLSIHLSRKHGKIEQLDGNTTDNDDTKQDEKYAGTKHYWKEGRLGSAYQTFLDAHATIEESELDHDDKENEKAKLLEARKAAFGKLFKHCPPWSLRT